MKNRKAAAALLAFAMMLSVTGCSKLKTVTFDDFVDYCEDSGASEFYFEEIRNCGSDDLENGIYCVLYSDDIEDIPREDMAVLKLSNLDLNLDTDDIDQLAFFFMLDHNYEDIEESSDFEDFCLVSAGAVQITLNDPDKTDDVMEGIEDLLDRIDVDPEDLSSDEYYQNKNGGFLNLHVDVRDLCDAVLDSDFWDMATENSYSGADDLEDLLENATGDICLSIYVENENIFIVAGATLNEDSDTVTDICSAFGLDDPTENPSCTQVIDGIIDELDDYASMIYGF